MNLRARFTVFFAGACLLLLASFSWLVYVQVRDNSLLKAREDLNALLEHEWDHLDLPSHQARLKPGTPHFRDVYLRIRKEGIVLYDTFPKDVTEVESASVVREGARLFQSLRREHNGHRYEISGFYDLSAVLSHLAFLQRVLFFCCLVAGLLIVPLSLGSTRFLLRPFRELAQRTTELTAEKLSFRFEKPKHVDEYGALAQNFNQLLDRLETSFKQTRSFAVSASHELRTPLSVIISQGEMIERRPPAEVSGALVVVQKMLESAIHLRNVVNRLFLLAEVERIEKERSLESISVGKLLTEVAAALKESYKAEPKDIVVECSDSARTIFANREILSCIVTNLMENAVKYSSSKIRIRTDGNEERVVLTFDDDGPGIRPQERSQVFEPFFRSESQPKDKKEGHGLGLSIVRACVLALRGKIELGSSTLGGLSVQVSIPSPA